MPPDPPETPKPTITIEQWKSEMRAMLNGMKAIEREVSSAEMDLLDAASGLSCFLTVSLCQKMRRALDKLEKGLQDKDRQSEMIRRWGREHYPAKVRLANMEQE